MSMLMKMLAQVYVNNYTKAAGLQKVCILVATGPSLQSLSTLALKAEEMFPNCPRYIISETVHVFSGKYSFSQSLR